MTYDEHLALYDQQILIIEADQGGKLFRKDRHGVMDCASDLRELEAEKRGFIKGWKASLEGLKQINENG